VVLPGESTTGYYPTAAQILPLTTAPNPNNPSLGPIVVIDTKAPPIDATVALVGLHVVGVVKGHPEFVWATFENVMNAPNLPDHMPPDSNAPVSGQSFTFYAANTAAALCNQPNQTPSVQTLQLNQAAQTLTPITNTFRQFAQGGGSADNIAAINTLNASVKSQIGTDPFANYQLIGGIWLFPGLGGTPTTPGSVLPVQGVVAQEGSLNLSNATLETFFQKPFGGTTAGRNCFTCHNTTPGPIGGVSIPPKNMDVSHLMNALYVQNASASQAKAAKAAAQAAPR
jgi:hypothetical protein